jgi:hypothetical protein
VGHELIEALSNFKLSKVSPLSPSSHDKSSSSFEAIVIHSKEKHRQSKIKSKSRKSDFKVVRDLLTKKYIIVKKDP